MVHPLCGCDFRISVWGFLLIIPGYKLIPSSVCKQIAALVSCLMLFLLAYECWYSPGSGDWSDLQGSGEFQDHSILSMIIPNWLVTVSAHAGRHIARQVRSMVRGLLCFLCLLKPEQVFNFNYPKKKEKQKRCDNAFSCCWCCCLVAKSYPTVCNPMYCRTSGSSFLYYLLEFAQINVHWVSDAI